MLPSVECSDYLAFSCQASSDQAELIFILWIQLINLFLLYVIFSCVTLLLPIELLLPLELWT